MAISVVDRTPTITEALGQTAPARFGKAILTEFLKYLLLYPMIASVSSIIVGIVLTPIIGAQTTGWPVQVGIAIVSGTGFVVYAFLALRRPIRWWRSRGTAAVPAPAPTTDDERPLPGPERNREALHV